MHADGTDGPLTGSRDATGPDDVGQQHADALIRDRDRVAAARRLQGTAVGSPALTRLTELAARLLDAGIAEVSLLGDVGVAAVVAGASARTVGAAWPVAESMCAVTAATGAPLVVDDAASDPRVAYMRPVHGGRIGSYLGVPLQSQDGLVVGALCVVDGARRTWTAADVALLEQLADSVSTELELAALSAEYEASRLRWGLAIDAAGIGSFDWDLTTGRLRWDERLIELFGYDTEAFDETLEAFNARLHPDDVARVGDALDRAIAEVGVFEAEYRVLLPGGETRWVVGRGRALADAGGTAVRLLGAAYDTTRQRHADARVARVLESMSAAFYSIDRDWRFTYVNAEAERLLQRRREELLGQVIWELFPDTLNSAFESGYRAAMASGEPALFEAWYPPPLDGWFEIRVWPSPDGLSVYFLEITERRSAERAARRSAARLELIAEVTAAFGATLTGGQAAVTALHRLARAVVPVLGDWSVVSVVAEDGRLHDVASWHRDELCRADVAEYARLRWPSLAPGAPLAEALGEGELLALELDDLPAGGEQWLTDPAARDVWRRLEPASLLALPLVARGRTIGALTVYRGATRPPVAGADLATAREIADRAALALDNLRLYEQQRRMAEELQRSLLTAPPETAGVDIAVRYLPAAEAAQVGGDWYDAFHVPGPDDDTVLVIGDVVGHDTEAAASMGQLRGLVRGLAFREDAGPAQVLAELDRAVEGLQLDCMATAAVARLGARTPEGCLLRWSNAGHPPLMVVRPDGTVQDLSADRADLMLGVDPRAPRTEHRTVLLPGSTVLLYTDGLVESRATSLDEGLGQLEELLGRVGRAPLDELCDALVDELRPAGSEDDVALVAVRLHG